MLCVISPAKRLNLKDWDRNMTGLGTPPWPDDVTVLADLVRALDTTDYETLMHISEKQAAQVKDYYKAFSFPHTPDNGKPACLMFSGDTYVGLDAESMSDDEAAYAQDHIVIISGLYGKLRPYDLVRPFRLDMGTKLATPRGKDLYDFWGDKIVDAIMLQMKQTKTKTLVNLASVEYFKAVCPKKISANNVRIITPNFKEIRDNGDIKVMSLFAKRARGAMARWIVENKITAPEDLKNFNVNGYSFQPGASSDNDWSFVRPQPPKKTKGAAAKNKGHEPHLRKYVPDLS